MPDTIEHLHAVILAGGSGQRLWPLSRELSPKQFLSVFGTESLITQTVRRVARFVAGTPQGVLVMTNERLFDELRNHLTAQADLPTGDLDYLVEPASRNTGPAVALAAAELVSIDPDALMVVLPADHVIEDGSAWADVVETGARLASDGYLVTLGVKPTHPETGYGYILTAEELPDYACGAAVPVRAASFIEKPELARAEEMVVDGSCFWNSGVFFLGAGQVLEELRAVGSDGARIAETCAWVVANRGDPESADEARRRFAEIPSISIDKILMERTQRMAMVPLPLKWSDVGSLLALEAVEEPDHRGNVRRGRGVDIDSDDNIIFSSDGLVATLGIHDLIVVDTPDATLVCPRDRAQDVRLVFDALKAIGAEELVQPKVSLRPWGSWTSLLRRPGFQIKLLEVDPGSKPSLQRHHHRSEHWVVVSGTASVARDTETLEVHVNESVFIPIGCVHRIENCGKVPLKVIEVQVGEYLGEDDIVRLDDDWDRDVR